jgi:asparagine synthetase B (glutamine-hydrolysing)
VVGPASLVYRRGAHTSDTLDSLLQSPHGATRLDPSVLAAWVVGSPTNVLERTPYEGIDVEHVTVAPRELPAERTSLADAPGFLRRALVDAVAAALVGVRRVAVMTGGGIDSSVLLALTAQWAERTGGSVFAISLDFEGPGDDRPHLRALQEHLECEVLRVSPEEGAHRISLLGTGVDAVPVCHPVMPMLIELLVRARTHGAERVLCGGGADELFGGSPQALADVAWRGHPIRALRAARRLSGFSRPRARAWSWVLRPLLGRALPRRVRAWRDQRDARFTPPDWAGPVARSFLHEQRRAAGVNVRVPPRTARQRFAAMRDDPHRVLIAWELHQLGHAAGIDVWFPYMGLDLAAAVASLPADYLLFGDRWRGLLRAAVRDLVPVSTCEREDKARFEPALRRFIDVSGGLESLRPLASMREQASLGLVDPIPFAAAFERFVASPDDGEAWVLVWAPLAVEAFLRGRAN